MDSLKITFFYERTVFDKVFTEIEQISGPILSRAPLPHANYLLNTLILTYGSPKLAKKFLMQFVNGIKKINNGG